MRPCLLSVYCLILLALLCWIGRVVRLMLLCWLRVSGLMGLVRRRLILWLWVVVLWRRRRRRRCLCVVLILMFGGLRRMVSWSLT